MRIVSGARLAAVGLLAIAGCTGHQAQKTGPVSPPPPARVNPNGHGEVELIRQSSYPEGTSIVFYRHPDSEKQLPLSDLAGEMPAQWPWQVVQPPCDTGRTIKVQFQDGVVVGYGPCRYPSSIKRLDAAIIAVVKAKYQPK